MSYIAVGYVLDGMCYIILMCYMLQEITDSPQLYTEGSNRFDVGQGSAGTCWFLSILAALADKADVLKQVRIYTNGVH